MKALKNTECIEILKNFKNFVFTQKTGRNFDYAPLEIALVRAISNMQTLEEIRNYITICKSNTNGMCDCLEDIEKIIDGV